MLKLLKKLLIAHEGNGFHPYVLRHHFLATFAILIIIANYFVFPFLGINGSRVSAASISAQELISYANQSREKEGLSSLKESASLTLAASAKAKDMFEKQYWNHYGPNGETPWQFFKQFGYEYYMAGENLARNFHSAIDAHTGWMNSPTHRANILNQNFKDIGIAVVAGNLQGEDTVLIVQMFGVPSTQSAAIQPVTKPTQQSNSPKKTVTPGTKQVSVSPPEIISPQDGTFTNSENITIQGKVSSGNTIQIYSNNKLIGEIPRENAAFTTNVKLNEEENTLYAKSKQGNIESPESNKVKVYLDKTPPDISNIILQIERTEESLEIKVITKEEFKEVRARSGNYEGVFEHQDNSYVKLVPIKNIAQNMLIIQLTDKAGNKAEKEIDISSYIKEENNNILGTFQSSTSSPAKPEGLFSKLGDIPISKRIDGIGLFFMLALVMIDALILYKKGVKREFGIYHPFNIVLILIFLVSSLAT